MTLSNFDWTDKESLRWFVLMSKGHEGPYSLLQLQNLLQKKKLALDSKIWAEGLQAGVTLRTAIEQSKSIDREKIDGEEPPPLPQESLTSTNSSTHKTSKVIVRIPVPIAVIGIVVGSLLSLYHLFFTRLEKIDIPRLPKMSLSTFERIKQENQFERWDRKIFFKEYLPDDNSSIWFVTASFQSCDVEASFRSIPNKLLSLEEESVSFRSSGHLSGHLLELFPDYMRSISGPLNVTGAVYQRKSKIFGVPLNQTISPELKSSFLAEDLLLLPITLISF
jgi:hypothetical protein